jgi:dTDP-4-amino-4,6-dideoxygalactose transaminase
MARGQAQYPFPFDRERIIYYDRGRSAILDSIRVLGIKKGERVLLPSYTCYDTTLPFHHREVGIDYYEVDKSLAPDKMDLEQKLNTGRYAALFIIHFFGFPQDLDYIRQLKKKYGIKLIEDCAHAFMSRNNDEPLGTLGDVSIFTLRKSIPLPSLGVLLVNDTTSIFTNRTESPLHTSMKSICKRVFENLKFQSGLNMRKRINTVAATPHNSMKSDSPPTGLVSEINKRLLRNLNYDKIFKARRKNFTHILDRIRKNSDLKPLFSTLPDGVSPLVFPLLIKERDSVCKYLNISGIDAFPWPYLPEEVASDSNNYEVARRLADSILLIPVHQDLKPKHINYILATLDRAIVATQ